MESSGNCKHFMLAGAEYNTDMMRKEDGEIGRSQVMKTYKPWEGIWTMSLAFTKNIFSTTCLISAVFPDKFHKGNLFVTVFLEPSIVPGP